jgi:hypothetical protein
MIICILTTRGTLAWAFVLDQFTVSDEDTRILDALIEGREDLDSWEGVPLDTVSPEGAFTDLRDALAANVKAPAPPPWLEHTLGHLPNGWDFKLHPEDTTVLTYDPNLNWLPFGLHADALVFVQGEPLHETIDLSALAGRISEWSKAVDLGMARSRTRSVLLSAMNVTISKLNNLNDEKPCPQAKSCSGGGRGDRGKRAAAEGQVNSSSTCRGGRFCCCLATY